MATVEELEEKIEKLEEEISALKDEVQEKENEISSLEEDLASTEGELRSARDEADEDIVGAINTFLDEISRPVVGELKFIVPQNDRVNAAILNLFSIAGRNP